MRQRMGEAVRRSGQSRPVVEGHIGGVRPPLTATLGGEYSPAPGETARHRRPAARGMPPHGAIHATGGTGTAAWLLPLVVDKAIIMKHNTKNHPSEPPPM